MLFLESQPALVVDHILVLFVKRVKQYERKDCQTYARGRVVDYNKEAGRLPPTTATSNTQTCQWTGLLTMQQLEDPSGGVGLIGRHDQVGGQ